MPAERDDARRRRFPVTEERQRLGWLVVEWNPYDLQSLPLIRIGVEPPLEDPAPPMLEP